MKVLKQIAIFLSNKPGTLASVTKTLSDHGINILGIMVSEGVEYAVVRLIVSDPVKAIHLLGEGGLLVIESDIVSINLKNVLGAICEVGRVLSSNSVNIEYAYGSISPAEEEGVLYLKVSDIEKAKKALSEIAL